MDHLTNNLTVIEPYVPDLAQQIRTAQEQELELALEATRVEDCQTMTVSTKQNKLYLHSRYNPIAEAEKIAQQGTEKEADVIVIGGFGMGYIAEAVLDLHPEANIVVIEKCAAILKLAFSARDLTHLLANDRFAFVLSDTIEDVTMLLEGMATRRVSMLIHRPSHDLFPDFYSNLKNVLYSFINSKEVNIATLARFEKLWTRNLLRNLNFFITTPGINQLYGKFQNIPAFIVAAGPSLSKNIHQLKKAKRHGIIIAVDTSYKVLLAHGIIPHFVVAVDPQLINSQYFRGVKESSAILITDCAVCPTLLRNFKGKSYISAVPFPFAEWFETFFQKKGAMSSGGSVSTSAFDLALNMGCDPLVLVGQDLAYSEERIHVRGTAGEEIWENRCNRLTPVTRNMLQFLKQNKTVRLPAYNGEGEVWTDRKFLTFLWWFEKKIISLKERTVYNATEGGAKIKGTTQINLAELLKKLPTQEIQLPSYDNYPAQLPPHFIEQVKGFQDFLNNIEKRTDQAAGICEQLLAGKLTDSACQKSYTQLDQIDQEIQQNSSYSKLLSSTLQRVIHSVREGFSITDGEKENNTQDPVAILKQSKALYQGIHQAAKEIKNFFEKYHPADNKGSRPLGQ